ncbi:hypothetical protein IQ06DRAFT_18563 [Phaeosphaeriaceae sp. SRC1lsM3a]|nr:hypothetical protein IQ06DRAFT_18563 [Stagonospora sp. SRC1lsM3a]
MMSRGSRASFRVLEFRDRLGRKSLLVVLDPATSEHAVSAIWNPMPCWGNSRNSLKGAILIFSSLLGALHAFAWYMWARASSHRICRCFDSGVIEEQSLGLEEQRALPPCGSSFR